MSQKEMVRAHLEAGGRLTPLSALKLYGIFRLGARVWELKHVDGLDVRMDLIEVGAEGKHVAEYYLVPKPSFPVEADGQLSMIGAS